MAGKRAFGIEARDVRETVAALKDMPGGLHKEMRKEFRQIAKAVETDARGRARAARPVAKTPKHAGDYRWSMLVNSIKAGAESDTPYVDLGSERVKGWAGWEFGSNRYPQFGPRTQGSGRGNVGRFFFPAIKDAAEDIEKQAKEVVERYEKLAFPN